MSCSRVTLMTNSLSTTGTSGECLDAVASTSFTNDKRSDFPTSSPCRVPKRYSSRSSFSLRSPPPSQHLKKILSNYPEGPQIFKEALQNADDGCAQVFRILLDERTQHCSSEHINRFLGTAIIFSNDGIFKDSDWQGLQNMFESEKTKTPGKIGRFGMGSRSYFHMTDVVSILSGSRFAFLDPDWAINEDGGASANLSELYEDLQCTEDEDDYIKSLYIMLSPFYGMMGYEKGSTFYNGTLIRLPLRMGRWARCSSFAPYEYTSSKANRLLTRFRLEAPHCLLFLQSVERIELWKWQDSEDSPSEMFSCSVQLCENASAMTTQSISNGSGRSLIRDYLDDQRRWGSDLKSALCQADTGHLPELESIFTIEEIEFISSPNPDDQLADVIKTISLWLINVRLVSHSDLLNLLSFTRCPPVVGIALLMGIPTSIRQRCKQNVLPACHSNITTINTLDNIKENHYGLLKSSHVYPTTPTLKQQKYSPEIEISLVSLECTTQNDHCLQGLAFSYLPLPDVCTGLPVHLHGTFQLTDNRRSLWMALEDTDGQAQRWSEWNHTLLTCAIPQLYARVILRFAQFTTDLIDAIEDKRQNGMAEEIAEERTRRALQNYYAAWPNPREVTSGFQQILFEFVRSAKDQKLIIREPQSLLSVSRRLASLPYDYDEIYNNSRNEQNRKKDFKNLPPFKPTDCHFLDLTDVEAHIFSGRELLLYEAVAQCQLLGHTVVRIEEWIKELFQTFDEDVSNNPASQIRKETIGLRHNKLQKKSHKKSTSNTSLTSGISGYFIVSVLDIFSLILLPHWASLPTTELPYVPHFTSLMLCICKILGRGPDKYIIKFRDVCATLQFIPIRYPGLVYDETESVPLKAPPQCFDPTLHNFKIGQLLQPDTEFRSPDVLRVLRLWGLKQTLGWTEMAQEAVSRMCVVTGCQANIQIDEH